MAYLEKFQTLVSLNTFQLNILNEKNEIISFFFAGRENNFDKAQSAMIDDQGVGYDYRSVMHYSANAFSKNGQPTIDAKVYDVEICRDNYFFIII